MRKNAPEAGDVVRLMLQDFPCPPGSARKFGVEMYANFIVCRVWESPFANVCTVREIARDGTLLPPIDLYWPDWCEDLERKAERD